MMNEDPPYEVRLVDFGLSHDLEGRDSFSERTTINEQIAAPEVADRKGILAASDVFSFGCLLQNIFTHEPRIDNVVDRLEDMSGPSVIPFSIRVLINTCKHPFPTMRPKAAHCALVLQALLAEAAFGGREAI